MKRTFALLAAGMVIAFWSTPASADLLIYEPFDYSSSSAIIGQTPTIGNTWARAGTASTATVHNVGIPSLTGPSGFPASVGNGGVTIGGPTGGDFTEYARMSLGSQYGTSSTLYYSLLLDVPSTTGLTVPNSNANANNDGIIAFNNSTGAGVRPNTWAGELVMRLGASSGFNLGVRSSSTAASTTFWTGDLTAGQTYLVVVGYTSGATAGDGLGLSSLWIDPNSTSFGAATPPTANGTTVGSMSGAAGNDHVDSLILGAGIAAGADPSQTYVDEIRVGTTWAAVTSVPEPSTMVLAGFGALGLIAWYRARRR